MFITRLLLAFVIACAAAPGLAQVLQADSLTTTEFDALDRARTAVVIPGGILEQHGPYLPVGSDSDQSRWLAEALGRRLSVRPGWTVLMLPLIPLGHSGANDIPRRWTYPGTITIRAETLRAMYMDLADSLGQHGFRYIFIVDVHGAPDHNRMLDQAADYFSDIWKGEMVPLLGLKAANILPPLPSAIMPEAASVSDGFTVHAGLSESSRVLFVRPGAVRSGLFTAPALTATDFADLVRLGHTSAWRGYWGAPAAATTTIGAAAMEQVLTAIASTAEAVLDGRPWNRERFYVEALMDPADVQISRDSAAHDATLAARQQIWLRAKGLSGPRP